MKRFDISGFKDIMSLGLLRTKNQIKDHKGEIIFGISTGLVIKGMIEACKATPDWVDIYDRHMSTIDSIKASEEAGDISEDEAGKQIVKVHWELSKDFTKKYCKSFIYSGLGFAGQTSSIRIMRNEINSWKGIAADLTMGLMAYRGRVADRVGADEEYDIFHNIKRKIVEEEYTDENGKKKKRKKEVIENPDEQVAGDHNCYWFGCGDVHWQGIKDIDLQFIIETEKMFNRILHGRGHGAKVTKEEVLRFFKWIDNDIWKLEANDNGWIYNENGDYDYYLDPITGKPTDLPRIIKFVCSKPFMDKDDDCDETWVELNCYPLRPILQAQQNDIIADRMAARGGRYISATI